MKKSDTHALKRETMPNKCSKIDDVITTVIVSAKIFKGFLGNFPENLVFFTEISGIFRNFQGNFP